MNRKIIFKGMILSFITVLFSCGNTQNPSDITENKTALEEIKKEPKVKEAIITDANVLYVSVEDDQTRRDGYAQYICEVLREHKSTIGWVKVVKVGSANEENSDNAYGVLLGEYMCN